MLAKADAKRGLRTIWPEEQRPILFPSYGEVFHNRIHWAYALVGFGEKDGGTFSIRISFGLFDVYLHCCW